MIYVCPRKDKAVTKRCEPCDCGMNRLIAAAEQNAEMATTNQAKDSLAEIQAAIDTVEPALTVEELGAMFSNRVPIWIVNRLLTADLDVTAQQLRAECIAFQAGRDFADKKKASLLAALKAIAENRWNADKDSVWQAEEVHEYAANVLAALRTAGE